MARVRELSPRGREAALVAAALSRPTVATLVAALGAQDEGEAAIVEAEEAGVIVTERARIRFAHPLLASAVYAASSTSDGDSCTGGSPTSSPIRKSAHATSPRARRRRTKPPPTRSSGPRRAPRGEARRTRPRSCTARRFGSRPTKPTTRPGASSAKRPPSSPRATRRGALGGRGGARASRGRTAAGRGAPSAERDRLGREPRPGADRSPRARPEPREPATVVATSASTRSSRILAARPAKGSRARRGGGSTTRRGRGPRAARPRAPRQALLRRAGRPEGAARTPGPSAAPGRARRPERAAEPHAAHVVCLDGRARGGEGSARIRGRLVSRSRRGGLAGRASRSPRAGRAQRRATGRQPSA